MQLRSFRNTGYQFSLSFADGRCVEINLQPLIGRYVSENELPSARLDSEWGCLEFCGGAVDVEPDTLYRYAISHGQRQAYDPA